MKKTLIKLFFVFIIVLSSVGCFDSSSENTEIVEGNSGKVIETKLLNSISKYPQIEIHKIKYISDNLEIVGFILKNKDNIERPTLIFNRGGNREFSKNGKNLPYLAYLASQGYTVLASQYRGADGSDGTDNYGGDDVKDVKSLITMAKRLPYADEDNIVMLGFSRGGMMTYLTLKDHHEIKSAVVVGAPTDLELSYKNRGEKLKNVYETLIGTDRDEWRKRSAIYFADEIETPLLILHGEKDWRVSPKHAKLLEKELIKYNKTHSVKIIPNGNHGLSNEKELRNMYILNWFDEYL